MTAMKDKKGLNLALEIATRVLRSIARNPPFNSGRVKLGFPVGLSIENPVLLTVGYNHLVANHEAMCGKIRNYPLGNAKCSCCSLDT